MPIQTFQEACERAKREHPEYHHLSIEEMTSGRNVIFLRRQKSWSGQPFFFSYATIDNMMPSGRVKPYLWMAGDERCIVNSAAIFSASPHAWCDGEPVYSHLYCDEHVEGNV